MKRKYGYIPSPQHLTYEQFSATKYKLEADLPDRIDLRPWCSPVLDQGEQGSCTAQAIVGLREFLEIQSGQPLTSLSRAFLYYEERLKEGTTDEDSGAMPVDGMAVLKTIGVCPEAEMPYSDQDYSTAPTDKTIQDAGPYRISSYKAVNSTALFKAALAEGHPVVIGIQIYDSFESDAAAKTGTIPIPNKDAEQHLGGHCMLAVGYDLGMTAGAHIGYVIVKNSWGRDWGDKGYCYIPLAYFMQPGLVSDYWIGTIAVMKGGKDTVTWLDIEAQVLNLLFEIMEAYGPTLAQEFIDELVKLIEEFIPDSGLSKLQKVSWVDIRNVLENQITQALLQAIAALIANFKIKVNAKEDLVDC